jgi:hypothetical protein
MPDITKCLGTDCPLKEQCYRFTSKADEYQAFFVEVPYKDGKCEMFWGDNNEEIFKQLQDIINTK